MTASRDRGVAIPPLAMQASERAERATPRSVADPVHSRFVPDS